MVAQNICIPIILLSKNNIPLVKHIPAIKNNSNKVSIINIVNDFSFIFIIRFVRRWG